MLDLSDLELYDVSGVANVLKVGYLSVRQRKWQREVGEGGPLVAELRCGNVNT